MLRLTEGSLTTGHGVALLARSPESCTLHRSDKPAYPATIDLLRQLVMATFPPAAGYYQHPQGLLQPIAGPSIVRITGPAACAAGILRVLWPASSADLLNPQKEYLRASLIGIR